VKSPRAWATTRSGRPSWFRSATATTLGSPPASYLMYGPVKSCGDAARVVAAIVIVIAARTNGYPRNGTRGVIHSLQSSPVFSVATRVAHAITTGRRYTGRCPIQGRKDPTTPRTEERDTWRGGESPNHAPSASSRL